EQEMPAQVHGDDGVPLLVGHVEQHPVAGDPGVVHDDVQPAQPVGRFEQLVGGGAFADVAGDRDRLGTGLGTFRRDLVHYVGGVQGGGDVVDDDGGALPGQAERLGPPQPRGGAGHHRDLPG